MSGSCKPHPGTPGIADEVNQAGMIWKHRVRRYEACWPVHGLQSDIEAKEGAVMVNVFLSGTGSVTPRGCRRWSGTAPERWGLILCLSSVLALPVYAADGASGKSTDEIARELANPNNSLASLTFKNQFRWYQGDLPGADDQHNYTLLFQPVFPFKLEPTESGGAANLFVRPAFPLLVDQPVPTFGDGGFEFDEETGLGDIGFDIGYGVTEKNGLLWALGVVGTLPTATDDAIGGDQFRLGPELLVAKFEQWGVYGAFPSHQWDVGGSNDDDYSVSQLQLFLKFLPGGGWNVGSVPIMNYDWESEDWTIPLNFAVGKTVKAGNTPLKLELEINYYVEQPDAFGPEWMIGINITPVVPNVIESWFRKP